MNKKLIAILTLVMFAITLLPMGAFAASKNTSTGFLPKVTDVGFYALGNIRISQDGVTNNFEDGTFTLDLPAGMEWDNASTGGVGENPSTAKAAIDLVATDAAGFLTATRDSARTMTVAIPATYDGRDLVIPVYVKVTSMGTGDIAVTITDVTTGMTSGDVVVGQFTIGSASIRALSSVTTGENNVELGKIRITENSIGALDGETITLRLPTNMSWREVGATDMNITVNEIGGGAGRLTASVDATDKRKVTFTNSIAATVTGIYDIRTYVTIDSDASYGDVRVSVSGSANVDQGAVVIGKFADYSTTVKAGEAKTITAGRVEQEIAKITVTEGLKESILANRDINFKLPSGVKFDVTNAPFNIVVVKGDATKVPGTVAVADFNADRDRMTIRLTGLTTSSVSFEIRGLEIVAAPNFSGEVKMTVDGSAGVSGDFVVATVKNPVIVEATPVTIKMGVQGQSIGEILVKEPAAETFISGGQIVLRLPENAEWSKLPTVEVVEGDLELGTIGRSGRNLTIPVDADSTVASTIKITGAAITTNRSIPEGDVKVSMVGSTTATDTSSALVEAGSFMANRNTVASVKIATVTTPAEDGVVQPVVMTVGSTVYKIDGVEMTMDVAPYIKDARTYFPVRYVAQALGITADNVVWDGAQRTVTIFRANRIVQVTIGSTTMLVNGVPLTMDVAPEITAERTMLPIRFVAQGLGVNVNWDAATQTVTLN